MEKTRSRSRSRSIIIMGKEEEDKDKNRQGSNESGASNGMEKTAAKEACDKEVNGANNNNNGLKVHDNSEGVRSNDAMAVEV